MKTHPLIKFSYLQIVLLLVFGNICTGQILVTGIVTDCEENPIEMVFIKESNTPNLTHTDAKGKFHLLVKDSLAKLEVYSIYNKYQNETIEIGSKEYISIKLKEIPTEKTPNINGQEIFLRKPVIYLYPSKPTEITLKLDFDGELYFTYPEYYNEWKIKAFPDGKIINSSDQKEYSYLFWDGYKKRSPEELTYQEGFVVHKKDVVPFLEDKLSLLGLTPTEYNEFIVYWAPFLKQNEWNFIHFRCNEAYNIISKNMINPIPDTEIRVFMDFTKINAPIHIKPQQLNTTTRKGFTLVEWGGTEIKEKNLFKNEH